MKKFTQFVKDMTNEPWSQRSFKNFNTNRVGIDGSLLNLWTVTTSHQFLPLPTLNLGTTNW